MAFKTGIAAGIVISILLFLGGIKTSAGQKVGVVLSGGGASGLAHIGFLRSLEENEIPIDYISGTSMGALVGALYASGYSTEEMEELFKSEKFQLWVAGKIDDRYVHYYKKLRNDAAWVKLKVSPDSILENNLPTNIINSTSLDFGLEEVFAAASAASEKSFDQLMIPFRCVASDISSKKSVVFRDGDLPNAIRASISYPFYLNPVKVNGKLLYDGGLYDNFPVSTLCDEFEPDYIIGSNVSSNFPDPEEDNLLSQIRSMMSMDTEYKINCEEGFIIEPNTADISLLDFSDISGTISIGYNAAQKKIDSIRLYLPFSRSKEEIGKMREEFQKIKPVLTIKDIHVRGVSKSAGKYIKKSLRIKKHDGVSFTEYESKILRLASDEKIKRIDPKLIYSDSLNGFILDLYVKKEKNFFVSFGGNISTMAVNEGFVGLQYNRLSQTPMMLYANTYFGRFYTSGFGRYKIDIPFNVPFQLNATYTYNKWDYFQNSNVLLEESAPSYLIQREQFTSGDLSFPLAYKGKLSFGGKVGLIDYEYYEDNEFTRFDTADITEFRNYSLFGKYERNSLNRKQYANAGNFICLRASWTDGIEVTSPGSRNVSDTSHELEHSWYQIKARIEQYFSGNRKLKYGFLLEGLYSDQPFFSNYASTLLSSPGFEPIPESKTIFRSKFRAHQYGAVGLRGIYTPVKNFDIRLEGFMFQPIKETKVTNDGKLKYEDVIQNRYFIGSFTLVYDMGFTQAAVNVNYYDNFNEEFPRNASESYTIMFHLGFILFNERMMD